ncbi:TetR/AcrR family transcriptional regulator [Streptomyces sp. NPDC004542]|uniref:TetR/AcrR family transcriptional regulator n=1 Tax=Streptomyces sp. NPDC004542 TaxID=3154281 RepID=UPI0033B7E538
MGQVPGEGLRDRLLDTALELASPGLTLAIPSLRAAARACGVSATAVYRYFASQGDLNRAILLRIDAAFVAAMTEADDPRLPPVERLRRLAVAYLEWGVAHPGLYQLRFESAGQLGADYVYSGAADDVLGGIGRLARAAGADERVAAEDLWVGMHGVVSLRIHKPHMAWPDIETQVDRLFALWGFAN